MECYIVRIARVCFQHSVRIEVWSCVHILEIENETFRNRVHFTWMEISIFWTTLADNFISGITQLHVLFASCYFFIVHLSPHPSLHDTISF